jgi:hypothetical protein
MGPCTYGELIESSAWILAGIRNDSWNFLALTIDAAKISAALVREKRVCGD